MGLSEPRSTPFCRLAPANQAPRLSLIFGVCRVGGRHRLLRMEHDAGTDSRAIRKTDVVGTFPNVFRGCVTSLFCTPLLQCRATLARLHGLRSKAIGPRYEFFRGPKSKL